MNRDAVPHRNAPPILPQWRTSAEEQGPISRSASQIATTAASQTLNSLLRLLVVTILVGALLLPEVELHPSFKLVMIALLLVLIGRTTAAPLLVVFQTVLFFRPVHPDRMADVPGSCLFVIIVMGLLMFLSRDRTLKWIVRQSVVDLWKLAVTDSRPAASISSFPVSHEPPGSFLRRMALLVICVVIAQLLLLKFPLRESEVDASGETVSQVTSTLATISFPLIVLVAFVVLMSELAWRRMTTQQASLYLRSTLMSLVYSDLRLVVRRQLTLQRHKKWTSESAQEVS